MARIQDHNLNLVSPPINGALVRGPWAMIRASRNWIKLKTLLNSERRSSIISLRRSVKGLGAIESETRPPSVEEISETSSPLSTPPTTTDGKTHRHCISRSLSLDTKKRTQLAVPDLLRQAKLGSCLGEVSNRWYWSELTPFTAGTTQCVALGKGRTWPHLSTKSGQLALLSMPTGNPSRRLRS